MKNKNSGFILINKPKGISSHAVIDRLREITKIKKIGHAGTLDPLATGLLIVGIGRAATKQLFKFLKEDKEYWAKIRLGAISDTYDKDGKIIFNPNSKIPSKSKIEKALNKFLGEIEQIPPIFSAKKIKGKKFYQLARKGKKVVPKAIKVKIYDIFLLNYSWPFLEIKVKCSSGTYIRSLANDIGQDLSCGAYLEELCRVKINQFSVQKAVKLSELTSKNWQNFLIEK